MEWGVGSGEWQKYYELAKRDVRTFLWAAMKSYVDH